MDINPYLHPHGEPNPQVNEPEKHVKNEAEDENSILEARVQALKQTISALKNELLEEKHLWRKEVELMASLISSSERCLESELITEVEIDTRSTLSIPIAAADPVATSPLIRDYEEKLSRYQGALAQAQAEKRLSIRRQLAAHTYRKRLSEVEKLCQEELDKVRETATYLEPLKQIASEWGKAKPPCESMKISTVEKTKRRATGGVECSGDFFPTKERERHVQEEKEASAYEVPVKQIDASLVMDEDASNEIKGKIVFQMGTLPSEVPTICYSAKFE